MADTSNPKLSDDFGFSISKFKTEIEKVGLFKNNLYLVEFSGKFGPKDKLIFYTSAVNLPSVQLATNTVRRFGYGPEERIPYRPIFNSQLRMDFYTEASNKSALINALNYMSNTVNFMDYQQKFAVSSKSPYEVAYKDDISFDISVYIYNEKSDHVLVYKLRECFVLEIDGINLSWEQQDQLLKASISFAFTDFYIESYGREIEAAVVEVEIPWTERIYGSYRARDIGTDSISSLQTLLKLGSAAQILSAIKTPQSVGDAINLVNNASIFASGLGL